MLQGSPFLDQIEEKIVDIKSDYDLICKEVPEFAQFPLREYSEIRMMVSSRIFGIQIEVTEKSVIFIDIRIFFFMVNIHACCFCVLYLIRIEAMLFDI